MTLGTQIGTAVGTTSCNRMAPGQERHLQKNVSIWLHFLKGLLLLLLFTAIEFSLSGSSPYISNK